LIPSDWIQLNYGKWEAVSLTRVCIDLIYFLRIIPGSLKNEINLGEERNLYTVHFSLRLFFVEYGTVSDALRGDLNYP
jgi:hypothetical protein